MTEQNKYANAKIYKLIGNEENTLIYVGSTCEEYLSNRFSGHKATYKRWKNGIDSKKTMSFELFEKYGIINCKIILLEQCKDITNIDQLRMVEQKWIDSMECINKVKAYIPEENIKEEHNKANRKYKAHNKKKIAQYYQDTKEHVKERSAKYYEDNKEHVSERGKIYRENNVENIRENKKQYAEKNKDIIKTKREVNIHCDTCDCDIRIGKKTRHERTAKHINNLKQ